MKHGKIIIICGPSGVGKGTIIKGLIKSKNIHITLVKTYTTRKPQKRDKNLDNHIYISKKEFLNKLKVGEFFESNFYNGNYYGTLKKDLENIIKSKKTGLLEQNLDKALLTKKQYKNILTIFIYSSLETIKQRLVKRGENTKEEIRERLKIAKDELKNKDKADYVVFNPENFPEKPISKILKIIKN